MFLDSCISAISTRSVVAGDQAPPEVHIER